MKMYLSSSIYLANAQSTVYPLSCTMAPKPEAPSLPIEPHTCTQKPSKHFLDNGDPLVWKKAKTTIPTHSSTDSILSLRTTSTMGTDAAPAGSPSGPPCAQPHIKQPQHHAPDTDTDTEKSDDEPIVVSDSDDDSMVLIEDDKTKLGRCCV